MLQLERLKFTEEKNLNGPADGSSTEVIWGDSAADDEKMKTKMREIYTWQEEID